MFTRKMVEDAIKYAFWKYVNLYSNIFWGQFDYAVKNSVNLTKDSYTEAECKEILDTVYSALNLAADNDFDPEDFQKYDDSDNSDEYFEALAAQMEEEYENRYDCEDAVLHHYC